MQANNDPKWTDDAAFWNEAWADMDKRLNQEPKDRKAVVAWWRRYGWLLGLILLVTAVATPAAMAYLSQDGKTEQQQQPIAPKAPATPAPTPAPSAVIAANTSESSGQETMDSDQTSSKATVAKSNTTTADVPEKTAPPVVITSVPTLTPEHITSSGSSAEDAAIVLGEQPSSFPSTANSSLSDPVKSGNAPPAAPPAAKEVPVALLSLTDKPIGPIEFVSNLSPNQQDVVISKPKLASRLYLDVGASNGFKGNKFGYYAGLQYSHSLSKRLSIPLGLRFRRDFHQFVELAESGTPARYLDTGNSTAATAPDTVLFEFTAENLNEVVTTSFEGHIGLDYTVTPRLRVGASLSINYLQAAIARVSPQYQQEFAADENRFLNADADITLVSGLSFFSEDASIVAPAIPLGNGAGATTNFPNFNHWVAHAGLNLSYDLTKRLSLTLSGRQLLAQPDQSNVIGLQRGQLEVGARWRLK